MQTATLLKKEALKTTVTTGGKTTTNPLQRKAIREEDDALQKKQNPLQLQTGLEDEEENPLQRKKAPVQLMDGLDDEEEPLQMKQDPLQLMDNKEEKLLQKKANPLQLKKSNQNPLQFKQPTNNPLQFQAVETVPPQSKKNNTGLPDTLKAGVENLSGYSMDDVQVHYNSDKPAQLQALAYAQGTDIHVGPGQEQHLPHEAWHVVQQKQGRVQPTIQMKGGIAVNDDKGLESEADAMGNRALTSASATVIKNLLRSNGSTSTHAAQRVEYKAVAHGDDYINPMIFINNNYTVNGEQPNVLEEGGSGGAFANAASTHGRDVIARFTANTDGILGAAAAFLREEDKDEYAKARGAEALRLSYQSARTPQEILTWYRQSSLPLSTWDDERFTSLKQNGQDNGIAVKYHYDRGKSIVPAGNRISQEDADVLNGPLKQGYVNGHYAVNNLEHRFINHIHVNKGKTSGDEKESIIYEANPETVTNWETKKFKPKSQQTNKEKIQTLSNTNAESLKTFDQNEQQTRDDIAIGGLGGWVADQGLLPDPLAAWVNDDREGVITRVQSIRLGEFANLLNDNPAELNLYRILYEWLDNVCRLAWQEKANDELIQAAELHDYQYYFNNYINRLSQENDYMDASGNMDDQYDNFVSFAAMDAWVERETDDTAHTDITDTKMNRVALGLKLARS